MRAFLLSAILVLSFRAFAMQREVCFRAIVASDTCGDRIAQSMIDDMAHMKKSLYSIAHCLHLKSDIQILKGSECSVHLIKKALLALHANSNDIVFFYYAGHGNADPHHKPWPVMYPAGGSKCRGLLGASIVKYFQAHPHRLSIILLDCCNESVSPGPYASLINERIGINPEDNLPGLETLFLESRGLVIGCGASRGECGWCMSNGSTFTNSFLTKVKQECKRKSISWGKICPLISDECLKLNPQEPQHPIWQCSP